MITPKNDFAKTALQDLLRYYEANQQGMQYKTYRDNELLVGSGPIESTHRNVLQQRLKLSGQRWSVDRAQAIANLRAFNKRNQWKQVTTLIKNAA